MSRRDRGLANRSTGFTLIELAVTLTIISVLAALAMPIYKTWVANAKVRSLSESMVANLRQAQAEAVKRYRRVVFYRADRTDCSSTTPPAYSAAGNYWVVLTIPLVTGDPAVVAQCGILTDGTSNLQISGWTALCFGTNGRPLAIAAADTGIGMPCTIPASNAVTAFDIALYNSAGSQVLSDRALSVQVNPGGGVRMCDKARTLASGAPDGC